MTRKQGLWWLAVAAMAFSPTLRAEHEDAKAASRPTAEAAKVECGKKVGYEEFQFGGHGLFALNTYDLKLDFDTDGQGLTFISNRGINANLSFGLGENAFVQYKGKEPVLCKDQPHACVSALKKMTKELTAAQKRIGTKLTTSQADAIQCAVEKLLALSKIALAETKKKEEEEASSYERSDSGVGMTFDGKLGIHAGGLVIPFDGSGPKIGVGF